MKQLFLSLLGLLLAATLSARPALGTDKLVADSVTTEGNSLAMMTQHLCVSVRNTGAEDCTAHLYVLAEPAGTGQSAVCADTLFTIGGQSVAMLTMPFQLPQGTYQLFVAGDEQGQTVLGQCAITIAPLRPLKLATTLSLDMLTVDEGSNVLYGNRLNGYVSVTNNDAPYFGAAGAEGVVVWLERVDDGQRLFSIPLASELWWGTQVGQHFEYTLDNAAGNQYALKVGYGSPTGLVAADSLLFAVRSSGRSYWTADGLVHDLIATDDGLLHVPAEAVAIDLRGIGQQGSCVTLDVAQANPNCLYYLDTDDALPQGLDAAVNVVRGLVAENIVLSERHDYFCPLAFRAGFVSFVMQPCYGSEQGYSETLVLPFSPGMALLYDANGNSEPLHADMLKVLRYYGNQGDSLTVSAISSIDEMQAYTPYILGVYVGATLLFAAEDTQVPSTCKAICLGRDYSLVGTTVARTFSSSVYIYAPYKYGFCFSSGGCSLQPFRACIVDTGTIGSDFETSPTVPANELLSFGVEAWGTEGAPVGEALMDIRRPSADATTEWHKQGVYTLSGQRLRMTERQSLRPGLYIVGGRKTMVR